MERLTEQGLKIVSNNNDFEKTWIEKVYNKLSNLEDIEEELGIDLITLFKAIKQKYIYIKYEDGEIVKRNVDMIDFQEGIKCANFDKSINFENYKQCYDMLNYIKCYGKTWALTKEELENK